VVVVTVTAYSLEILIKSNNGDYVTYSLAILFLLGKEAVATENFCMLFGNHSTEINA
jgi:hypothetical protein